MTVGGRSRKLPASVALPSVIPVAWAATGITGVAVLTRGETGRLTVAGPADPVMPPDARVPLLGPDDIPAEYRSLFEENDLGELSLFQAMAHVPRAMKAYMRFGTALWHVGDLSTRERELAILSVARTVGSRYEWHQHVALGREAGIDDETLGALARAEDCGLSRREQAVVRYAAAVATGAVTPPLFEAAVEATDTATVVGLTLLAGHYVMTARFVDALAVPIPGEFAGWVPGGDAGP